MGQLQIVDCEFTRTKHLLLLTYLALEGARKRHQLAELFWEGLKEEKTNKGERRDLHNLSTTLSQIRKYVGKDSIENGENKGEIQTPIPCDSNEFLKAFKTGEYEQAWSLYQGAFLHDIEHAFKFHAFDTLYLWIMNMRERFAQMAQKTLIELAKCALEKEDFEKVRYSAELAHDLPAAPPLEPAMLSQITSLLLAGGSPLAAKTSKAVDEFLEEADLSEEALKLFLILSLQEKADFGVARVALKVSAKEASKALEELVLVKLVGGGSEVLALDVAQNYLDDHPALLLPLLLDLASVTLKDDAFSVYQRIYKHDKTFGGLGYLQKAKIVYLIRARQLAEEQDFQEVAKVLKDIREAEERLDVDPDLEVRFLEIYAFERMAYFQEALRLFEGINFENTPKLLALKAILLMRLGRQQEAQELSQVALEQADDSEEGYWGKALALNCLGNVAYNVGNSEEAASLWRQTATYWQLLDEKLRYIGTLNNLANAVAQAGLPFEEIKAIYDEAIELLDEYKANAFQKAQVLLNLGLTYFEWDKLDEAEKCYLEALSLLGSEQLFDKALHQIAILHINLGELYIDKSNIESAKVHLQQAINSSLKSGRRISQAYALAELARLRQSPKLMQTALEIFESNGATPEVETYQSKYEAILKNQLKIKLSQQQFSSVKRLSKQLRLVYKQQQDNEKAQKIEHFFNCADQVLGPLQLSLEKQLEDL